MTNNNPYNPYIMSPAKENPFAYLFWFFLGPFGAHRFYLNQKTTAWWQLGLSLSLVGLIVSLPWSLVDAFLIPRYVREENARLATEWEDRQTVGGPGKVQHSGNPYPGGWE